MRALVFDYQHTQDLFSSECYDNTHTSLVYLSCFIHLYAKTIVFQLIVDGVDVDLYFVLEVSRGDIMIYTGKSNADGILSMSTSELDSIFAIQDENMVTTIRIGK